MRPPKHAWPDTPGSRGVLFFAQQMSELLTPTTFESFRVYSLDTLARMTEAIELGNDVLSSRIPRPALDPIIEEIQWSLQKDIIINEVCKNEIESLAELVKNKNFSIEIFVFHVTFIRSIICKKYKILIEKKILDLFRSSKKIEFRKAIGFYCSHLINIGYMRPYIMAKIEESFLDRQIFRAGSRTLESFFRNFDGETKRFTASIAVSDDLANYLKKLNHDVTALAKLNINQINEFRDEAQSLSMKMVLEISTEQLDPHRAMLHIEKFLSSERAISYLDPKGMKCEWGKKVHVTRTRALTGSVLMRNDILQENSIQGGSTAGRRLKSIQRYSERINSQFDETSTERILSSINTAALARTSANPENQLISLWSAIEVLLSEPRGIPRIVHYANLAVPCIVTRHIRRQILAVYDELYVSYRRKFRSIIQKCTAISGTPPSLLSHTNFAAILFLQQHDGLRGELVDLCKDNPLALHRLWKISEDYKTPRSITIALDDHYKRVDWQLHRIYRARNQLVHAGRTPSYLESIIINAAEYYRSAISSLVHRARRDVEESNVDQVVAEIQIQYGIFRRSFGDRGKETAISEADVKRLMALTD